MMLRVSSQLSSSRPLDLLSLSFYFTATFSYNNITHISFQAWLIPAERCRRSWWPAPAVPCTRRGRPGPAPPPPPAPPLRLGAGQLAQAGSPHCTVGNWGGPHLLSDLLLQVIKTNFLFEKMKLNNGQQIWILIGFCIRQTCCGTIRWIPCDPSKFTTVHCAGDVPPDTPDNRTDKSGLCYHITPPTT